MLELLVGIGLFLSGAFILLAWPLEEEGGLEGRVGRLLGLLVVAFGIAFIVGILRFEDDRNDQRLEWRTDVEQALAEAKAEGRPAILDATAAWCASCKELEEKTFSDPEVKKALSRFMRIRVDMTAFDEAQRRLDRLGISVQALPLVAFFLPDGRLNPGVTLNDFEPPSLFLKRLERAEVYQEAPLSRVEVWLGEHGILWALVLVFFAGIGVSLTPCVYPMIPITIATIGAGSIGPSERPKFRLRLFRTLLFVSGLCFTYAILGVTAGATGSGFGAWMQHPLVTGGLAALFGALAASYVGFFRFDVPEVLKARASRSSKGLLKAFLVGAAAGAGAAPCAGPVVVGILAVVATSGDVALGLVLMLAFGFGMGLLFFAVGLSTEALRLLPKGGAWTARVELIFALLFLVVAIYFGSLAAKGI